MTFFAAIKGCSHISTYVGVVLEGSTARRVLESELCLFGAKLICQGFEQVQHMLIGLFEDLPCDETHSFGNFEPEQGNVPIKPELGLSPSKLSQHVASVLEPLSHDSGERPGHKRLIELFSPVDQQDVSNLLQSSNSLFEDQLFDIPEGIDEVRHTSELRSEDLIGGAPVIKIALSFDHVRSKSIEQGCRANFGQVFETTELPEKTFSHQLLEDFKVLIFKLLIGLIGVQFPPTVRFSFSMDKTRARGDEGLSDVEDVFQTLKGASSSKPKPCFAYH